jgi:hypothetical protein
MRKYLREDSRMNIGRPKTGRRGKSLNIYIPLDIVGPAKRHFHVKRGISLSEGITRLLRKELRKEAA